MQVRGPLSEEETKAAFAEHGIDYKTRSERYKKLRGTQFEFAPARYYIAYAPDLDGKPVAVQGIAPYKDIYLLSGLKSYGTESGLPRNQTKGAGRFISKKVIDLYSNRPIVGVATTDGLRVFREQGFKEIAFEDGKVVGQEDIPDEILEIFERDDIRSSDSTSIRKLYYKPTVSWFYHIKKGKKKSTVNQAGNYTKPKMRKRQFQRIKAGSKGGPAGKWSARKAQMLAQAYKRAGGGYRD